MVPNISYRFLFHSSILWKMGTWSPFHSGKCNIKVPFIPLKSEHCRAIYMILAFISQIYITENGQWSTSHLEKHNIKVPLYLQKVNILEPNICNTSLYFTNLYYGRQALTSSGLFNKSLPLGDVLKKVTHRQWHFLGYYLYVTLDVFFAFLQVSAKYNLPPSVKHKKHTKSHYLYVTFLIKSHSVSDIFKYHYL